MCDILPSQPLGEEAHAEGGEHASNGEDGHRQGPEGGEGPCGDGLVVPLHPCFVVVRLNDLHEKARNMLKVTFKCFIVTFKCLTCYIEIVFEISFTFRACETSNWY